MARSRLRNGLNYENSTLPKEPLTDAQKVEIIIECLCNGVSAEFARRCGIAENTVSNWKSRNSLDVRKVYNAFPELSTDWIIDGVGPMFTADLVALEEEVKKEEHARAYEELTNGQPSAYKVAEGESVDRALLNMLLQDKANLMQELAVMRQRNLELEKDNAVMKDRLANAEKWYYQNCKK